MVRESTFAPCLLKGAGRKQKKKTNSNSTVPLADAHKARISPSANCTVRLFGCPLTLNNRSMIESTSSVFECDIFFRPLNSGAKFPRFTRVVQKPRSREGLVLDPYSRAYSSALYPFNSVSGRINGAGLRPCNFAETKKNCEEKENRTGFTLISRGSTKKNQKLRPAKKLLQKKCSPLPAKHCRYNREILLFFLSVLYFSRDAAHGILRLLLIITDYERRYLYVSKKRCRKRQSSRPSPFRCRDC